MPRDCNQPSPEKGVKTAIIVTCICIIDILVLYYCFEQVFAYMGSVILTAFWAVFYFYLSQQ